MDTGGGDHAVTLPEHGNGSGVGGRPAVPEFAVRVHRAGRLVHRDGFPGQGRLVDSEFAHADQPQVGGHPVSGDEPDDVAGHQVGRGEIDDPSVPVHAGAGCEHRPDRVERRFGPPLLHKSEERIDHDGGEQHRRVDPVLQERGDDRGAEHHVEQDVVELP